MTGFFQRGGAWVLAQSVLLAAVIALAIVFRGSGPRLVMVVPGVVLMVVGAGMGIAGALALGKNLSPFPRPGEQVRLVRHGIYSVIRHPIYTSVISGFIGWALVWQSWPALTAAVALVPFFHAKARREERWLREKFPEYADYERHAHRFVPW